MISVWKPDSHLSAVNIRPTIWVRHTPSTTILLFDISGDILLSSISVSSAHESVCYHRFSVCYITLHSKVRAGRINVSNLLLYDKTTQKMEW